MEWGGVGWKKEGGFVRSVEYSWSFPGLSLSRDKKKENRKERGKKRRLNDSLLRMQYLRLHIY